MAVDKNLFLHDLAVVAIMKNEGHYLKEWLDYHLLAGVDHFYLYDNDSTDNQAEVAKSYVAAGLVDYFPAPGQKMQELAYNDAVKRFKFQCRYMAFIDGDEFIYPKSCGGGVIVKVIDEILAGKPNAAGLAIHWQIFGSNGHEKADYSHGVLERFTRRAPSDWHGSFTDEFSQNSAIGNSHFKAIANPRRVKLAGVHVAHYFEGYHGVDERGIAVQETFAGLPIEVNKIAINHYYTKSKEEFAARVQKGYSVRPSFKRSLKAFDVNNRNDEFDDGILRYRAERAKTFRPPDKSHADERLFAALATNLSPTLVPTTPPQFYAGKLETFLTCRAVAAYLKTRLTDDAPAKFFEEAALKAILRTIASGGMSLADARLLIRELPNLLPLPYPAVKDLRGACLHIIPQMMNVMRVNGMWKDYVELDYLQRLLKIS